MQGLAKSIAWDGEGATCLIEVKWSKWHNIQNFMPSASSDYWTYFIANMMIWLFTFLKNDLSVMLQLLHVLYQDSFRKFSSNIVQSSKVLFSMQVTVTGSNNEAEAAKIARSVASSSLVKVGCCLTSIYCSPGLYEHYNFSLLRPLLKEA